MGWQSWWGSLPRPGGSTCGCPPGGHCPRGTGGTATSEHFGSVGRGLLPGRPPGVAEVGAAPCRPTPRGSRVRGMRPPPVHPGAGDPAGRAEVGGTPAPRPPPLPPPARPRPRPGPAPEGPAPAPAPGGPAWPGPARASPAPLRLRPTRGLPRPGRASPGRRRRRPGAGARSSPPWCGRRCRYRRCRSRCRCRGLRSRRRLHRSGDIVPLNRSPRRPAPPARRRDLSATAPPRRHDGEVRGAPSPPAPPQGGAASGLAAMLGVAKRVTLKGPARPESRERPRYHDNTLVVPPPTPNGSSSPHWYFQW